MLKPTRYLKAMPNFLSHQINQHRNRAINAFAATLCAFFNATASAVQAPYQDNFDSYSTGAMPNNFVTGLSGAGTPFSQWDVQNPAVTAGVYRNLLSGPQARSSAAISVTNLQQVDFILSTTFVINSYGLVSPPSLADIRVGLGALGSGANFPTTGYQLSYEVLDIGNNSSTNGALQIYEADQLIGGFPFTTLSVATGIAYTMTLIGTHSTSGLLLTGTLSDGSTSIMVTAADSTPQTGTYFGYYNLAQGQVNRSANLNVSYDNFSIVVPEPRTVSFVVCAFTLLALWHKRRQRI